MLLRFHNQSTRATLVVRGGALLAISEFVALPDDYDDRFVEWEIMMRDWLPRLRAWLTMPRPPDCLPEVRDCAEEIVTFFIQHTDEE